MAKGQALINEITAEYMKNDVPEFRPGDTVRVHVRIKEGGKKGLLFLPPSCIIEPDLFPGVAQLLSGCCRSTLLLTAT